MTKSNHSRGRASVLVSLRLSVEEKKHLQGLAKGQTLSAYIRSRIFNSENTTGKNIRLSAFERQKLLAQILTDLGKTNLGASLHELSQAAKIGALPLTPDVLSEINKTLFDIKTLRRTLLKALGLRQRDQS